MSRDMMEEATTPCAPLKQGNVLVAPEMTINGKGSEMK
jgi:hypothetical protein